MSTYAMELTHEKNMRGLIRQKRGPDNDIRLDVPILKRIRMCDSKVADQNGISTGSDKSENSLDMVLSSDFLMKNSAETVRNFKLNSNFYPRENVDHFSSSQSTNFVYTPDLTATENPYYYQYNKLLFELYVERVQRTMFHCSPNASHSIF